MLACLLGGCVSLRPSGGSTLSQAENVQVGLASWYGKDFHGRRMADGGTYDMYGMMAAHKTLPLGTKVRVTNLANRKPLHDGSLGRLKIQFPADEQQGISNQLDFQATLVHAPDHSIVRIDLIVLLVVSAVELIGSTQHNLTNQLFDRPTALHEAKGKVVEQFRV